MEHFTRTVHGPDSFHHGSPLCCYDPDEGDTHDDDVPSPPPPYNASFTDDNEEPGDGGGDVELDEIDALLLRCRNATFRSTVIDEAPELVKRLNSFEEIESGNCVTFACQWRAIPKPSVTWYRDDELIVAGTHATDYWTQSHEDGTEELCLRSATKHHEGAYKCRIENKEGSAVTTGYLSVTGGDTDKILSIQHKKSKSDHSVSSAPHLRTIVEQKSVEEREESTHLPASPLQQFIDDFRKGNSWPHYPPYMSSFAEDSHSLTNEGADHGDVDKSDTAEESQMSSASSTASGDSQVDSNTTLNSRSSEERTMCTSKHGADVMPFNEKVSKFFNDHPYYTNGTANVLQTSRKAGDVSDVTLAVEHKNNECNRIMEEVVNTYISICVDQLDNSCIHLVVVSLFITLVALITNVPIPYFVMSLAICSLILFRFVFDDDTILPK